MEISEKRLRRLTASEGCRLTQAGDVALQDRVYCTTVFLAANDAVENWQEIPEAEAEEQQRLQAEERMRTDKEQEKEARRRELEEELRKLDEES